MPRASGAGGTRSCAAARASCCNAEISSWRNTRTRRRARTGNWCAEAALDDDQLDTPVYQVIRCNEVECYALLEP